jgi:PAS domain-containing protein
LIQEVEQGRGLLRALMENSPDLIFFKDCDSRFTRVNRAQARSFEVQDAAECVGKSDADYFEPADALRWLGEEQRNPAQRARPSRPDRTLQETPGRGVLDVDD